MDDDLNGVMPWGNAPRGWTALPNAFDVYLYVEGFSPMTMAVYWELLKHYNSNLGYAYPSQETLALSLNTSKRTVIRCINTLESVGLISKKRYKSLVYTFIEPLSGVAFAERFPEAAAARDKKRMTLELRRYDDEQRLDALINDRE